MRPRQEASVTYSLTWQRHADPWYFAVILIIFFILNMGYLGYLVAYARESGIFGWFLLLAECYRIGFSLVAFYCLKTVMFPLYELPLPNKTVDVLIPTLNEDISVVGKTIVNALKIRGVRNVLVLDDGNRRDLQAFVEEKGGIYLARDHHEHAKAGNLNFGLLHTDAQFLITLDADHVPEPQFIERTLGYFRDPLVAFVQTPQVFYNRESFQHRTRKEDPDWTEQTMFYEAIQPAKNTHNAAFFCGSSAILRREALDSVGGFATGTATEDIHTAIRIHQKRWKSVFINEKLAYGLAPDDFKEYYRQRVRWGAGSLGLLFRTSDSPFWCKGLTPMQRLCYINSMLGFTQGEIKLLYFFLPMISLIWLAHIPTPVPLVLLGTLSYLVFSLWMVGIYSRGTYHFLFTEQYNIANIFSNIASLKGVIRIQKKFGVSIKTKRRVENTYISAVLFIFLLILGVFEVGGFIHGYLFYHRNIAFLWERSIGLALFWNIYNMGMIGSFLLFVTRHHKKKAQSLQKSPQIATLPAAFSSFRVEQA
jgi:cellulose synthase (UDP-forming)